MRLGSSSCGECVSARCVIMQEVCMCVCVCVCVRACSCIIMLAALQLTFAFIPHVFCSQVQAGVPRISSGPCAHACAYVYH